MKISVLRLGHRFPRDVRVSTHCCLVSRALGAEEIILSGQEDPDTVKSVKKIINKWGGSFKIKENPNWKKVIKEKKSKKYKIIHLTMYGLPLNEQIEKIKKNKKLTLIIGSQKVERQIYEEADYNISIGNQPHSEIAALAVFLDRVFEGKELNKEFDNAKTKIIPSQKSKKTTNPTS